MATGANHPQTLGYGDDDDFCRRIYDNGWWVAVALGSYIFHNHRTTFKAMFSDQEIKSMKRKNMLKYDEKFDLNDENRR